MIISRTTFMNFRILDFESNPIRIIIHIRKIRESEDLIILLLFFSSLLVILTLSAPKGGIKK